MYPLTDLETLKAFVKERIDPKAERIWKFGVCQNESEQCPICEALKLPGFGAWSAWKTYLGRQTIDIEEQVVTDFVRWVDQNPEEVKAWLAS